MTQTIRELLVPLSSVFLVLLPLILNKPKAGIWLICFLIPISPSILIGQTEVRDITLRLEDMVFVITALAWIMKGGNIPKTELGYRILKLISILALLHMISTLLFLSRKLSQMFFLLKYIQYWSYFLLSFSLIRDRSDVKVLLVAYFLGVSLALAYWMLQVFQGKIGNAVRFPFHQKFAGRENVGIFTFGIMAFSLPFFLRDSGIRRFFFLFVFFTSSVVYFRTLSRASYLAGLAWVIFVLLFLRRKDLFIIVLIIIMAFPFIAPDYVLDRIKYTFTGGGGGTVLGNIYIESSGFVRIGRWKYFLFEQLPADVLTFLFGYGVLGVGLMDNQYLRVWGEAGTLGFIVFIILLRKLWRLYFKIYRSLKADDPLKAMMLGMICWYVGILVHMIPANTLVILQTSEMFWLMSGAVAALEKIISKEKEQKNEEHQNTKFPKVQKLL